MYTGNNLFEEEFPPKKLLPEIMHKRKTFLNGKKFGKLFVTTPAGAIREASTKMCNMLKVLVGGGEDFCYKNLRLSEKKIFHGQQHRKWYRWWYKWKG